MKSYLLLPISLMILFSSCRDFSGRRIRGNGKIQTESRPIGAFDELKVEGNFKVSIRQDSAVSASVTADENLLPYVELYTRGNTLVIRPKENVNLRSRHDIRVELSNPAYRSIIINGACAVKSETGLSDAGKITVQLNGASKADLQVQTPVVDAELSGASTLIMKGQTRDVDIRGTGASEIRCFDLMAENTKVELTGAGSARVFASVKLEAEVTGAASVQYRGNAEVSQRVSGAGSVRKAD